MDLLTVLSELSESVFSKKALPYFCDNENATLEDILQWLEQFEFEENTASHHEEIMADLLLPGISAQLKLHGIASVETTAIPPEKNITTEETKTVKNDDINKSDENILQAAILKG